MKLTVRKRRLGSLFFGKTAEAPAIVLELTSGCMILQFSSFQQTEAWIWSFTIFFFNKTSYTPDFAYIDSW